MGTWNNKCRARVFVYVRQVPDHGQAHRYIWKWLSDTPDVLLRIIATIGRKIMGPIRVPLSGICSSAMFGSAETAWCTVARSGSDWSQVKLSYLQELVEQGTSDSGNRWMGKVLGVFR